MSREGFKLQFSEDGGKAGFKCPGCNLMHWIWVEGQRAWRYNSDPVRPTFSPSILFRKGDDHRCHSFVADGRIRFLSDCTHDLAGKSVDLPDLGKPDL